MDVESDEEFVSVDFSCGSMVWIKYKGKQRFTKTLQERIRFVLLGFPWWPGMVDYCPDVQETYLPSKENPKEAGEYHVV